MSVSRPSRIELAHIYSKRIIRWRRNSSPYISGDAFSDIADYVFNPPRFRNFTGKNSISNAKVIFCKSDELNLLFERHHDEINAKVIITGNSDFEFHEIPKNIPPSVRAMFLQNSFISDNRFIFSIPIGIENFRLGVNGNPRFIRPRKFGKDNLSRILFGPLSATHPIRESVVSQFGTPDARWSLLSDRLTPRSYDRIANSYSYIAAVRGNGVDTHRLWEALYRGRKAIIANDDWSKSLLFLHPFVSLVNDWEVSTVKNVMVRNKSDFDPKDIPELWMPYWKQFVQSAKDQN